MSTDRFTQRANDLRRAVARLAEAVCQFLLQSGQVIFQKLAADVAQWQTQTP